MLHVACSACSTGTRTIKDHWQGLALTDVRSFVCWLGRLLYMYIRIRSYTWGHACTYKMHALVALDVTYSATGRSYGDIIVPAT